MALISPQAATVAGPAITYATVGASDTFVPQDRGVLLFRTTGTGSTITFTPTGNTPQGVALPNVTVTMGATDARAVNTAAFVGYANGTTGLVTYTTSSQTGHTVAYVSV